MMIQENNSKYDIIEKKDEEALIKAQSEIMFFKNIISISMSFKIKVY